MAKRGGKRGGQQDLTPYDTIFSFIFGSNRPKRSKPGPGIGMPDVSGLAGGLAEIASAPAMYGVNYVMGDVGGEMDSLVSTQIEPVKGYDKFKVGPSGFLRYMMDPHGFVGKAAADYEGGEKWAKKGGWYQNIDSALFAIYGKAVGLSTGDALHMAAATGRLEPFFGKKQGSLTAYKSASDSTNDLIQWTEHKYGVSKTDMEQIVKDSGNVGTKSNADKDLRRDAMKAALVAKGLSEQDAWSVAEEFWGKRFASTGFMKQMLMSKGISSADADVLAGRFWKVKGRRSDEGYMLRRLTRAGMSNADAAALVGDIKSRWEDDSGVWWRSGADAKKATTADEALRAKSFDASLKRLQISIDNETDPTKKKRLEGYRKWLLVYQEKATGGSGGIRAGFGIPFALGMNVGRAMHIKSWVSGAKSEYVVRALLFGNTKAINEQLFSVDKMLSLPLVKGTGVYDGYMMANPAITSSLRTKFAESLYYYHPANLVKGMLWDGRFWAKMASNQLSKRARDRFLTIAAWTPKRLMKRVLEGFSKSSVGKKLNFRAWAMTNTRKLLVETFRIGKLLGLDQADMLAMPIKELLKRALIKIITQLLSNIALPGMGTVIGFVVDRLIGVAEWLGKKLIRPALEMGAILLWGIIAAFAIGIWYLGGGDTDLMARHQNTPYLVDIEGENPVGQDQWAGDSTAPAGYTGCPVSGMVNCTQGGCGNTSHGKSGTRSADLTWSGMTANPEIYAPANGTVVSSQSSATCSDGTNHGGQIKFKDENGYTWFYAHVRPTASGSVSEGGVLGAVMFAPDVESGKCWTGAHVHISIQDPSGNYVDVETFLNSAGCSFSCPAADQC